MSTAARGALVLAMTAVGAGNLFFSGDIQVAGRTPQSKREESYKHSGNYVDVVVVGVNENQVFYDSRAQIVSRRRYLRGIFGLELAAFFFIVSVVATMLLVIVSHVKGRKP